MEEYSQNFPCLCAQCAATDAGVACGCAESFGTSFQTRRTSFGKVFIAMSMMGISCLHATHSKSAYSTSVTFAFGAPFTGSTNVTVGTFCAFESEAVIFGFGRGMGCVRIKKNTKTMMARTPMTRNARRRSRITLFKLYKLELSGKGVGVVQDGAICAYRKITHSCFCLRNCHNRTSTT